MTTPGGGRRRKRLSPHDKTYSKRKPVYLQTMESCISDTDVEDLVTKSQTTPLQAGTEKATKPRQPAIYKTLLNIFSDPDSPVMKALVSSIVTPITSSIQEVLHKQTEQLNVISAELEKVETESREKDIKIRSLERDIEELQQYGRRNAVIISGVGETEGENTDHIALDIANNKLNIKLEPHEISRSHRLGPLRNGSVRPRNIVVKLATYNIRKRIYDARRSLRNTGIFTSEHLTRHRGNLFYEARQLLRSGRLKHVWTSDGRVLVRNHDGVVFPIRDITDLDTFRDTVTP